MANRSSTCRPSSPLGVRELSTGHGRKHDPGDAVSIALAALGSQRLHQVAVEDHATVLRLLSDRRDDLVATRTRP